MVKSPEKEGDENATSSGRTKECLRCVKAKGTVMGGQQVCNQTFRPDDDGMCGRPAPPHLAVSSLMNARICDDYTGWPMRHP